MRRRVKKKSGVGLIAFIVLTLCAAIAYKQIDLKDQSKKKQEQIEKLEARIQGEEERAVEIENFRAYVQTKGYIEKIAREKLGLVNPDDVIFKKEE